MKRIFIVGSLLIILAPGLFAGQHSHNKALKQYIKQKVMPVLVQKRQILEAELSADEKTTIANCKASLKQIHDQKKAQKHSTGQMSDNVPSNSSSATALNQAPQQKKAIMRTLDDIAVKHAATLATIKNDLAPSCKQWQDDIQKLTAQSGDSNNKQDHKYTNLAYCLSGKKHHSAARFLLLPTTEPVKKG